MSTDRPANQPFTPKLHVFAAWIGAAAVGLAPLVIVAVSLWPK